MRCTPYQQHTRGMTLIEMIVVVAIFSMLSLAVATSISSLYRFNAYTLAQSYQVAHARRGVEFLVRDAREMTYADDGTFPLAIMEPNRIGLYSDIDRDDSVEYVEYELMDTVLTKRVYGATGTPPIYSSTPERTEIISEYVQNALQGIDMFAYYDASGAVATATSTVTDIRYVEVQAVVNVDPVRDPDEFMLRSSAALRNLTETNN